MYFPEDIWYMILHEYLWSKHNKYWLNFRSRDKLMLELTDKNAKNFTSKSLLVDSDERMNFNESSADEIMDRWGKKHNIEDMKFVYKNRKKKGVKVKPFNELLRSFYENGEMPDGLR